jgi:predicted dehydrogenase
VIRVAVVGTGSISRRHLGNLLQLGVREVVAVSEHSRRGQLCINGVDVPVVHRYGEVLGTAVDAVVIGNPTSLHLGYLWRAIEAGKDVLCEKPVATTTRGIAKVSAAASRRGLIVGVGHQFRFNEKLGGLRSRVMEGELGTMLNVEANLGEHIADYHPGEDYRTSYAARADLGGGILLTQIHLFDLLQWIFGPFARVFAVGGHRTDLELDVEDSVSFLLATSSGLPVLGHLDYLQRPKRFTLAATGTGGRLEWDYHANRLTYTAPALDAVTQHDEAPFDRNAMFIGLMRDFLDAVHERRQPRSTLDDALASLRIVDAVRRSCREGRAVTIEDGQELEPE